MPRKPPALPGRTRPPATQPPAAIFGDLGDGRLRRAPLDAIVANPHQPRRHFDDTALQALADSIATRGLLQPPVVRETQPDRYELVAGERRVRASRIAGLTEIDVLVQDDAGDPTDALMENTARQDLGPVELAHALASLIEDLGVTREELGRRIGHSRVSISNHLRLLDLPDSALEAIDAGRLTFAHGRALLLCDDHQTRKRLAAQAQAGGWSTRQLEDAARAAGAPRSKTRRTPGVGADRQQFTTAVDDALTRATGLDLALRASGRDRYTLTVTGHDALLALAKRVGATDLPDGPAARTTRRR